MVKAAFLLIPFLFLTANLTGQAQVLKSHQMTISFFSEAPIEDIKSESRDGVSALDAGSGSIYFKVAIRTFEFEKSLMQEHFNENYLESSKYPYAEFNGKIKEPIDLARNGSFPVTVSGNLNIHNVTKNYTVKGLISVKEGKVTANASFPVQVADHEVKIPRLLIKNIAETVQVSVSASYGPASPQVHGTSY
ncbi:MAG: YceI family protein [Prolixibacteraceae bacterium]